MKVSDFINLFKTGGLGKKRQHSSYRVMDGDHCQLLVRATKRRGVPGGSELIGIYFGHDVTLFHNNFNKLRDSVTDAVSDPKPVINGKIIKQEDEGLIDSGIIGIDDTKGLLLLEIGETPWLLEHDEVYTPNKYAYWTWNYNTATQVSKRVGSIAEATGDIVLPDGVISNLGYLLRVMPSDFIPLATNKEDEKLLMNPPNPFNYGLTLDDLIVQTVYGNTGRGCVPLYVKRKIAASPRGAQFKADADAYNEATVRFEIKEPSYWENLTSEDKGTVLIGANGQVYLKGHVWTRYHASSESATFKVWHQVLGKTSKLRLPAQ